MFGGFRRFNLGNTTRRNIFLGGDLNGCLGSASRGCEGLHGGYDRMEVNAKGTSILDFSSSNLYYSQYML